MAILLAGGIILGLGLALVLHEVRGSVKGERLAPCTADWLKLAATVGLDDAGKVARVGLTAPGPADCLALGKRQRLGIQVTSADGKLLLKRSVRGGPVPGTEVFNSFGTTVTAPALKLCKAKQPLHFSVSAIGLTAAGDSPLHYAGGRCFLG